MSAPRAMPRLAGASGAASIGPISATRPPRDGRPESISPQWPTSSSARPTRLGYRYVGSPIIREEPGGPEHLFREYVPTTWPGARLPHVWLDGHVALQDRLGPGYTLLRLGATGEDASALQRSFAAYGAPFEVLDIADDAARDVCGYDLILLRPDLHIVWRGNRLPIEPNELAAIATGHL